MRVEEQIDALTVKLNEALGCAAAAAAYVACIPGAKDVDIEKAMTLVRNFNVQQVKTSNQQVGNLLPAAEGRLKAIKDLAGKLASE